MLGASPVAAQTIGNTATNGSISNFGNPDTQTYGQVFTAPISGELESFTLNLNAGVGSIMGGVGTWNGSPTWRRGFGSPINLYLSSPVASSVGGAYTFTPNISLVAGNMYVAYVSVYGLNLSGNVFSQMPRGSSASGLNYFVWHNSSAGGTPDPIGNPSWNYFSNLGNVLFSASIVNNSYFDGAGPSSDGIVQGGAGQWDNATLNWTNDIGTSSGVYRDGYTNLITFGGNNGGVVNVSGTRQFGILSFAVDGYLLTGSGTLAINNATISVGDGLTATISNIISGVNGLTKSGAGTLTLTGANSYTGGTLVSAGRLTGNTTSLQGAIVNNALVEFAQVSAGTYAGAMSGTGGLTKTGAGTLTLTGANSYSGGTLVSAGRLTGDTTSLQGAIVNNAAVEFAQSTSGTYAGAMSGTGGLTKTGGGTLTLTGANSYTGGTLVSAGRLTGNTTSLQGAIVNNAEVEFAQSTAGAYAGNMAGSGAFYKSGVGSLALGGITSITGAANIIAGRLNITGQLTAASVTVQNAATLSGNGVIAGNVTVQSGGSLAPGESAGTLSVVGNVSFLTGSNFGVEIDGRTYNPVGGAGSYDLLRISGVANLGGTIAPTLRGITGAATNNYVPSIGDSFLVLSAGTVVGNFSSVVQPASGLPVGGRFDAIYGGDFVRLVVTPSSFAALANAQNWIGNGSSAARGIDNIRLAAGVRSGASQTLFNGLYGMNAAQLQSTFSQISGEIYANSLQSVTETERSTFSSIFNASCDVSCGMPDGEAGTNRSIWGRYIGKYANHDGDQSASGYNSSSKGLAVGATLTDSNYLQFGVAASYVENEVSMPLGASSNTNATAGYLYLHYTPSDNFNFSSVLGVSLADTQVMRSIGTTGGKVSVNSEKQSMTILYGTKVSYRNFLNGPLSLWTDAGLELSDTSLGRVSERAVNSDFALLLDKVNRRSAETQMSARLQLVSDDAQISLSAGWVYELGDDPSALRKVELGDANWTVRSVDKQRHGIRLGMQSRAQLSKRISLSAMYQHTNQGNGYTYDRANVGLNFAF
jgi:autotransporter-associated beta strand protein